jgi:hypothetical protein
VTNAFETTKESLSDKYRKQQNLPPAKDHSVKAKTIGSKIISS